MACFPFKFTLKTAARGSFVVIIVVQAIFLALYPGQYENSKWYSLVTSFLPALIAWSCLMYFRKAKLRRLFYVWILYIMALIVNIGIIFGLVGDKLDSEKFLGPNVLKGVLCLTPPLLLLLLHNADDLDRSDERKDLVSKLSYQMAIDLFDVVDMIDIVLDDKGHGNGTMRSSSTEVRQPCVCVNTSLNATFNLTAAMSMSETTALGLTAIPEGFGAGMVAVASVSLLMSIWQLFENKLSKDDTKTRFKTAVIRNMIEIACVNFVFLIIRGVVYVKYHRDESIFIAKNIISIILSILDIHALCESHSTSFWSLCKSCFGLRDRALN